MARSVARNRPGLTLAAATVALASAALLVCPAGAFMRLMGNSYNSYCDAEGSVCLYDSDCCSGLECSPAFQNMGGGICKRQSPQHQPQQQEVPAGVDTPCQADPDCAAGQCCLRRVIGIRGASISTCQVDCSSREADRILDEYYSRYYRRAARSGKPHHHRHGDEEQEAEEQQHDRDDKKKKKSAMKKKKLSKR